MTKQKHYLKSPYESDSARIQSAQHDSRGSAVLRNTCIYYMQDMPHWLPLTQSNTNSSVSVNSINDGQYFPAMQILPLNQTSRSCNNSKCMLGEYITNHPKNTFQDKATTLWVVKNVQQNICPYLHQKLAAIFHWHTLWGGIINSHVIVNFPQCPSEKLLKSVNIWWRYGQKFGGTFFMAHGVHAVHANDSQEKQEQPQKN